MGEIRHREPNIELSEARVLFHEYLHKFRGYFKDGETICDIGVSERFDYAPVFEGCDYFTIDKREETKPDVRHDITKNSFLKPAEGIICMGVMEQVIDLQTFIDNLKFTLAPNGLALFGIRLVGMPIYADEFTRFTVRGVQELLTNFSILEEKILAEKGMPAFYVGIARKK